MRAQTAAGSSGSNGNFRTSERPSLTNTHRRGYRANRWFTSSTNGPAGGEPDSIRKTVARTRSRKERNSFMKPAAFDVRRQARIADFARAEVTSPAATSQRQNASASGNNSLG